MAQASLSPVLQRYREGPVNLLEPSVKAVPVGNLNGKPRTGIQFKKQRARLWSTTRSTPMYPSPVISEDRAAIQSIFSQ